MCDAGRLRLRDEARHVTFGVNYKPHANVLIRPEVRYDWYDGAASGINGRPLPFDTGTSDDQFMFATDVIVTF